ncbi:MAG: DUF4175 family protein [Bacteroidota bacterium]
MKQKRSDGEAGKMESREFGGELRTRLAAVRRKEHRAALLEGSAVVITVLLALVIITLATEGLLNLDSPSRTVLFWLIAGLAVALIVWRVLPPVGRMLKLLRETPDSVMARTVGDAFPEIRDRLLNTLQIIADRDTTILSSASLIDAAAEDFRRETERIDFTSVVTFTHARRLGQWAAGVAGAALLLFILFPSTFFGAAHRLLHYSQDFAPPAPFRFIVEPADKEVIKGENVSLRVRVEGAVLPEITLAVRPEGQAVDDERLLAAQPDGSFRFEFTALKNTLRYAFSARGVKSQEYTLRVIDRPVVKLLRLVVVPPSYSRLPRQQLEDNVGDVTSLKGSTVSFSVEANKDLQSATLVMSDSTAVALRTGGRKASGSLVLIKEKTYHLELRDSAGTPSADPVEYGLHMVPDASPTVAIVIPGTDQDVADNTTLPLLIKVADDYGYTRLRLAYKLVHSRYEQPAVQFSFITLPLPPQGPGEALVPHTWDISGLHLVPEDVVSYYAEVFDNDVVSGPKSAMSEIFSLRLPSLDEVFADADKQHEASLEQMSEALKQAEEAHKGMEELRQDLQTSKEKLDWQQRAKAEELMKKYEEIHAKMEDVQRTVEQMTADLQNKKVLSKETLEKYEELQHMMQQLSSPEFLEAMKKLQQAMQQLSPEALRQALQQFTFSEESFRQSIERTLNLLKRIQIEQKVDEALKRAQELAQRQKELQEKTEKSSTNNPAQMKDLAREQKDLTDREKGLEQTLKDIKTRMEEFPSEMPLKEMEEAERELRESGLGQKMGEIADQLQQMQKQQAAAGQQEALGQMRKTTQQLQGMQQSMRERQQQQIVNEMRKAIQDLLELSGREEALKNDTQGLEQNSQRFRENAQGQMEIMRDLGGVTERLANLSQKTFSITPEMGKSIGDALRGMGAAMQSLEQRNRTGAAQQQAGAMGSLNETARLVQGAIEALRRGGGQGMGMAGLMQRLQGMAAQQQGINEGTENLGGLSAQQAAEMARLAAEQGMVRKSLEQLTKEATASGELSKLLGDLTRVAQEMREVQTDLAAGNVNPETVRKQERILSRLLDAQRSAHERDFEKQRKSTAGRAPVRPGPGAIDLTTQEGKNRLRRDLQKALDEGYARDYEEIIRKYFEALEQHEQRTK